MIKNALIHVENTENVIELSRFLVELGWTIHSANNTEELLKNENIPVTTEKILSEHHRYGHETSKLINAIHSTKLPQENEEDYTQSSTSGYFLVCLNIDPQIKQLSTEINYHNKTIPTSIQISVILRNAFLNYHNIIILTDPQDYEEAMIQLRTNNVTMDFRTYLAAKALNMVSAYDSGLSHTLMSYTSHKQEFMNYLSHPFKKSGFLSQGSNKHQKAALYEIPSEITSPFFSKLIYKDFDYNTVSDLSFAWDNLTFLYQQLKNQYSVMAQNKEGYSYTTQFTPITGTVFTIAVKYGTIIGASLSTNALDSFKNTYKYGNTIENVTLGCSSVIDKAAAEEIVKCNFIAVVAPDFTQEARAIFAQQNITKLISSANFQEPNHELQMVISGILYQSRDACIFEQWHIKTNERPSQYIADEMAFGMILAMRAKSHCVILLKNNTITGIGQNCLTSKKACDIALMEAKECLNNNTNTGTIADLLVCDSSIELCDSIKELVENGLSAIIQTGTNSSDDEFINYCNEHGVVMIYTNTTHITI